MDNRASFLRIWLVRQRRFHLCLYFRRFASGQDGYLCDHATLRSTLPMDGSSQLVDVRRPRHPARLDFQRLHEPYGHGSRGEQEHPAFDAESHDFEWYVRCANRAVSSTSELPLVDAFTTSRAYHARVRGMVGLVMVPILLFGLLGWLLRATRCQPFDDSLRQGC